jgi:hypothetical protein
MRHPALNPMFLASHVVVAAGAVCGSDWSAQTKRTRIRAGGLSAAGGKIPE